MIRHIAMFTWKTAVTDETLAAISTGLDRLATLDCVTAYHHGPDAGLNEGNHDYVVVGDFATEADLRTYGDEEGHLALLADLIRPNIASRAAIQLRL